MIKLIAPGFLGLQLPRPEGLPDVDTGRVRMIRLYGIEPGLPALDPAEEKALFLSLAATLGRAKYHQQRLTQLVELLEQRRVQTGGVMCLDTFSQYALFEASACLGAVRLGVDEVIFIAARLRSVTPSDIRKMWEANLVMKTSFIKRPDLDIPEIFALRKRHSWYSEMNEYRNVFFHRGWRYNSGAYFPVGSTQTEALDPELNAMMMPDRDSLSQQKRSHQWTYAEGVRVETVVERAVHGFEDLLDDVCINIWGETVPAEGTLPKEHQPNVMVLMVRPVMLGFGNHVILPVFTSEVHARALDVLAKNPDLELVSLNPTTLIVDKPAFAFSMHGSAGIHFAGQTGDLAFVLDPIAVDAKTLSITARAETRIPWAEAVATEGVDPISLPVEWVGAEQIFVWRRRPTA
jgi:hypothetical protein